MLQFCRLYNKIKSFRRYSLLCNQFVSVDAYTIPLLMLLLCWSGVYCCGIYVYDINCSLFDYNKKIKTFVIFGITGKQTGVQKFQKYMEKFLRLKF